jgi:hypothetical protein
LGGTNFIEDSPNNPVKSGRVQVVFPDADDGPPGHSQLAALIAIPKHVRRNLLLPPSGVRAGRGEVPSTAVPEAPIEKYADLRASEDHISGAAKFR